MLKERKHLRSFNVIEQPLGWRNPGSFFQGKYGDFPPVDEVDSFDLMWKRIEKGEMREEKQSGKSCKVLHGVKPFCLFHSPTAMTSPPSKITSSLSQEHSCHSLKSYKNCGKPCELKQILIWLNGSLFFLQTIHSPYIKKEKINRETALIVVSTFKQTFA